MTIIDAAQWASRDDHVGHDMPSSFQPKPQPQPQRLVTKTKLGALTAGAS